TLLFAAEDGFAPGDGGGGSGLLSLLSAASGADGFVRITFNTPDPDAAQSTVGASPAVALANSVDSSQITVTVRDAAGVPIEGTDVTLAQDGASDIAPSATVTSAADGTAVFTVTNTTVQLVTYTATAGVVGIIQTATVDFIAPTADAATSTVTASP